MTKQNFRQDVTDKIINLIEKGEAIWQKPWDPKVAGQIIEMPHNGATNRPYHGANTLNLIIKAQELGCGNDPRWLTYKQAKDKGWQVRRGEKGTTVEYWKFERQIEEEDPKTGEKIKKTIKLDVPSVFYATVFHASQIEGIPAYVPKERGYDWNPVDEAERILTASGAKIIHDQRDSAYNSTKFDNIHLPPKESFPDAISYYQTALHELSHWTGTESRLNRDVLKHYHEDLANRAKEELRAEIASLYLSIETGVPFRPDQHGDIDISNTAAYTQSWVKALRDDKNEIFRAAKDAEIITDYVLELAKEKVKEKELDAVNQECLENIQNETKNRTLPERYRSAFKGLLGQNLSYSAIDKKVAETLLLSGDYSTNRVKEVLRKYSPMAVKMKEYADCIIKTILTPEFKKEMRQKSSSISR